jgi:hypothetical protein
LEKGCVSGKPFIKVPEPLPKKKKMYGLAQPNFNDFVSVFRFLKLAYLTN